jgi:pimeloyl-ACP methyl ester carboxylesterase
MQACAEAGFRAAAVDAPGFGGSPPLGRALRMEDLAQIFALALDHLHAPRAALVGCSMGGYTALAIAGQAPARVRTLVLAPSAAAPDRPERKVFRDRLIENLRENGPPPNAARGVTVDDLATAQAAIRDRADTTEVVRTFPGTFVACAGTRDELIRPEQAEDLAALAPHGRAATFDAGHFINLDDPDGFRSLIAELL